MAIYETSYSYNDKRNKINPGWGIKPPTGDKVEIIMRNKDHVLSPSYDLWQAWQNRKKTPSKQKGYWKLYTERFLKEMETPEAKAELKRIAELSINNNVWLVCSCFNKANHCHRFLVLKLIKELFQISE